MSEAEAIKVAIDSVEGEVRADAVAAIISLISKNSFGLSDDDMVKRLPSIQRAAEGVYRCVTANRSAPSAPPSI
jgi:hypothetical protein